MIGAEMDLVKAEDLVELADELGGSRVSLFMPTSRQAGRGGRNRIRLKNLTRHAEHALAGQGLPPNRIDALLEPARQVLDRVLPRADLSDGLAVFLGPDGGRHMRVPVRLPEAVTVGDRFVVSPLLPMLTASGHFYVLALDQDEIRLLRGDRFGMAEVALDGLSLAVWVTLPRRRPQGHAFATDRGGAGNRAGYHGEEPHTTTTMVAQHFHRVDQALREVLGGDDVPLVLAGVRAMQAVYRQVNTYPHLVADGVDGSPRGLTSKDFHRCAWPIVEPVLRSAEIRAAAAYREKAGTGRTCHESGEVLSAAEQGRIETLFLCTDAAGGQRRSPGGGLLRPAAEPDTAQHVEFAAVATLRHGGDVFAVPRRRMPDATQIAAVLRY
jgi:hypothetical protein